MARTSDKIEAEITQQLITLIEAGGLPPWQRPWVTARGANGLPYNHSTGVSYTGLNTIRLWATALEKGFESSAWITRRQLRALGGRPIGTQEDTACVFWKVRLVDDERAPDGKRRQFSPQPFWVLNIEQCEDLPESVVDSTEEESTRLADGETPADFDSCYLRHIGQQAIENSGLQISWGGSKACYMPTADIVWMPDGFDAGNYPGFASVLSHELIHATGHPSRLDRFAKTAKRSDLHRRKEYAYEELVAELGAVFLCTQIGVPMTVEQNAAYLDSWLRAFKRDTTFLSRAAGDASRAARFLAEGSRGWPPNQVPATPEEVADAA